MTPQDSLWLHHQINLFNAEYAAGPVYAGVGFEQVKDGSNDGRGVTSLAFHYNFGVVKVLGGVQRNRA